MKDVNTPIRYIKGVGPQKSRILAELGVETVSDMLYYLPFRYEDRSNFTPIGKITKGDTVTIKGEVKTLTSIKTKSGIFIFQAGVDDGTGMIYGVWFHQPYLKKVFKEGQKVIMHGKAEKYDKLQINHPQYEIIKGDEEDYIHAGRIVPMYHLTRNISQRYIRSLAYRTVAEYSRHLADILPTKLRARNKLVDSHFSVINIHIPTNEDTLKRAYNRIVFDEFFMLQLAIALKRKDTEMAKRGVSHPAGQERAEDFIKSLPFKLTEGQKKAIKAVREDMGSAKPMHRLIQGDVGSGKTVVAAYALLLAISNGYQGALMAPTEILAEQHYVNITKMFVNFDVNVAFLVHGLSKATREELMKDIKEGRADIVVGTHALIQEGLEFNNLGLVVIDEQHKFGVSQRAILQKGERMPDTLLMTATPIPRTLALTVYGDLDVSVIKDIPPGRGEITTYWISDSHRERVYNFLREEISKNRQAYIVCPRLEETNSSNLKSAKFMFEEFRDRIFKDLKVELIHGKMDPSEKDSIMETFKKGDIDILVSTVVIEVGIDVPNASVMVIENAERFGLSQLHQLRGRIGRGKHESYCVLISDADTDSAGRRLSTLTESVDGFEIAEEDLKLRGPGDIFGTRQHGLPEIRFGNIMRDMEIMELARKEAFSLVESDPGLIQYGNKLIRENLNKRFKGKLDFIKVG